MRKFDYRAEYQKLLTPETVSFLTQIHEGKERQNRLVEQKRNALNGLREIAGIESAEASNRMEGAVTTDDRLKKLVRNKTTPKNRSEREIAGYRDVLGTIYENYDYIPIRPGTLLQLHRDLYKFSGLSIGGGFKNSDDGAAEELPDGSKRVRPALVSARETPETVESLCGVINEALRDPELDPLLLIPMFILDFLCIRPFNDGNGRMSRLLTSLLLCRAGYFAGKYISLEKLIADSKEICHKALQDSAEGWRGGTNDYLPFVRYLLGVIAAAYREFSARTELLTEKSVSKPNRVRESIRSAAGRVTKAEIMAKCPDVSQKTVERALRELTESGAVLKVGGGRYTFYIWNRENE